VTNHVLLATDRNEDEPDAEELLRSLIAGFFPLSRFLSDLATVSAMIAQRFDLDGKTVEGQLDILHRCAIGLQNEEDLVNRLRAGEYTSITDENQIANLAMYAIGNRAYGGLARRGSLLRTLALFNKLSLQDQTTEKYYVVPDSVQGAFSVANTFRERANNVTYRYWRFIQWCDAVGTRTNVRATFRAAKGMDYEQYAEAAVHLDEYFGNEFAIVGVRSLPEADVRDPVVLEYLRRHCASPEDIDLFLGVDPMRKLRDEGFHQAMERPFLKMGDEFFLLHPRALENALGAGVFYAGFRSGEQQEYFALVGQFFEEYIGDILQRLAALGGYIYSGEIKYIRSVDREEVASNDHVLFRNGALLFFEDRYARIPKELLTTLDLAKIETALQTRIMSKFCQLSRNIEAYLAGDFEVPGVDRAEVRSIYPIVVLPHAFPRGPAIQERFDAEITNRGYAQGERGVIDVRPYEIAEAEALEGLAGLPEAPVLSDILERKFADNYRRCDFFKNHLILREKLPLRIWSDDEMRQWYRDVEDRRRARVVFR
jgi:hypothetical protein